MPLLVYPQQMLQMGAEAVGKNGALSRDLYYLLLALFNRSGQGSGTPVIALGLVAVAPPGTAPLIAADWNEFATVPNGGVAQIPPIAAGSDFIVWNLDANTLLVTPQPNVQIDALGVGTAFGLIGSKMQWFRCTARTQIRSMQLG